MLAALALAMLVSPSAAATIQVTDAWARATPGTSTNAAVYFTLTNTGGAPDKLVSAESAAAGMCELHETTTMSGMMHMGASKAVDIPAGGKVMFAPNGRHLMLMGLKKPLREGEEISVTLHFTKARPISAKVSVLDVAAMGP